MRISPSRQQPICKVNIKDDEIERLRAEIVRLKRCVEQQRDRNERLEFIERRIWDICTVLGIKSTPNGSQGQR